MIESRAEDTGKLLLRLESCCRHTTRAVSVETVAIKLSVSAVRWDGLPRRRTISIAAVVENVASGRAVATATEC